MKRDEKSRADMASVRFFFVTLPSKDSEITPSRQKKETSFFVLRSTFRNFVRI